MKAKKFATQIDEKVLKDLKAFASESDRSISKVVSDAIAEYLHRARLRPAFRSEVGAIITKCRIFLVGKCGFEGFARSLDRAFSLGCGS